MKEIISQGAEAILYKENDKLIKERISKGYRIKELDEKIRKTRTKRETKLLVKASSLIKIPKVFNLDKNFEPKDKFKIEMEFIDGKKLSETLDSLPIERQKEIMFSLGKDIAKLHKNDIIHGDLTTSNIILKNDEIYFVDFGLGFISKKIEDKAVELHLIKQALEAKHWKNYEILFDCLIEGYKKNYEEAKKILEQLKKVEKRGRYKF